MSESFGLGVSRTLSAFARKFSAVVWQDGKPPLDSELNLMSQIDWENLSEEVRSRVHSGFFLDPTRCESDYLTDPLNANQFILSPPAVVGVEEAAPVLYAAVNGWVFPVAGTDSPEVSGTDSVANRIRLSPPPTTAARTDFVFLEVWRTLVSPNPSTVNKPDASQVWKFGNTQYGGTNLTDDLEDPSIGYETTKRVQLQYRFRVVGSGDSSGVSIDLVNYPDGLTDPNVRAQGTAASPPTPSTPGSFVFTNMRSELGDPSLWRAGDGSTSNYLGTVDGYVYAVPVCAVFRRNAGAFTAISSGGSPNPNGAAERTPSSRSLSNPRSGARTLAQAALTAALNATDGGVYVNLDNYAASALNDPELFPLGTDRRYLVVGEGSDVEIIAINVNAQPGTYPNAIFIDPAGRGRGGTMAKSHPAGTSVSLYNGRPDGLYADQVADTDLLDMRRSVNFGDWDYNRLLQKGVAALVQNNLRTSFKESATGANTEGTVITETSYFLQPTASSTPSAVAPVDGTDGIRTVWSDSAAVQSDVTVILDDQAALVSSTHVTSSTFDAANRRATWRPACTRRSCYVCR